MTTPDTKFSFPDDETKRRITENFNRQGFLIHAGAELGLILPGFVEILLPHSSNVDQQHGYFHGGATATIADSSAGIAAQTLIANGSTVLTTEFKINFVAPAIGDRLIARGRVIKPGRTLTVCQSDIYAEKENKETLIATALLTMILVPAMRNREKDHVA